MTDALSTPLPRPPDSGPGSGLDKWAAFAAQETGEPIEMFEGLSRDEVKVLLDHRAERPESKEAPDGVDVLDEPKSKDALGRPEWMVPVEGGYASETEIVTAEREAERERQAARHQDRVAQLAKRKG